ncbi:uncharacterized protein EV420DRAFT_1525669 [Desarmillaria tabescens]|uniref:Heterokaryon incompatibility domain-containing protein n=1 Tax=Armillaria tabescens TaxID=1929756 RepID=A0AA39NBH7_ARMTA|nr:uncharacterized protein EV420DRAFT_1525669 [Desarmillaria tabescens]KAK0462572.1 hypothetical protein EV420DRAFT_1525669 [Desarmillaria tabescens]
MTGSFRRAAYGLPNEDPKSAPRALIGPAPKKSQPNDTIITALTETDKDESSIKVPLQLAYAGGKPVISSSLADTPCAILGTQGILDKINATLGTTYTLNIPSLSSILEEYISNNYDFGTAYSYLRSVWFTNDWSTIQDTLHMQEEKDKERRQKAVVDGKIVDPYMPPRCVWDLYSNRVVPSWIAKKRPLPISHAWLDEENRIAVYTPINGKEWPVPMPKSADLHLIRIEMLNLEAEYVWLDVLCLRQNSSLDQLKEKLRTDEWKLDVPTIGNVYDYTIVVIYLSGLGLPFSLKEGDFESERCWFQRAWTLQEIGLKRIIAGDMPSGPLHVCPVHGSQDYKGEILMQFQKELELVHNIMWSPTGRSWGNLFTILAEMQKRKSTNSIDKIAGLSFLCWSEKIPAYYENQSVEDAWTALVNVMAMEKLRRIPGNSDIMTYFPPADVSNEMCVWWDEKWDVDWRYGPCIEKGFVQGLAVQDEEIVNRYGKLIVKDKKEKEHTFKIIASHNYLIPENTYVLLGTRLNHELDLECSVQHWAIGHRVPSTKQFEKVSVFKMADKEAWRLKHLNVTKDCDIVFI